MEGIKPLTANYFIEADPNLVFQYIVDLSKRLEWNAGLDDFKYDESKLNDTESNHICVVNGKNVDIRTVFSNFENDELIYVEETADVPFMRNLTTVYSIKEHEKGAKITLQAFLKPKNILGRILMPLIKKQLTKNSKISIESLKKLLP